MSGIRWAPRHPRNLVSGLFLIVVGVVVLVAHVRQPATTVAVLVILVGIVLSAISLAGILRQR